MTHDKEAAARAEALWSKLTTGRSYIVNDSPVDDDEGDTEDDGQEKTQP